MLHFLEARLQYGALPAISHGAARLKEPLLTQLSPIRHGLAERFIFLRDAHSQLLDLRSAGPACQLAFGASKLGIEPGTLDLKPWCPFQVFGEPTPAHGVDEPLGRIPLPPAHAAAVVVRKHVMKIMVALAKGHQRHQGIVARRVVITVRLTAHDVGEGIDKESEVVAEHEPQHPCKEKGAESIAARPTDQE